MPLNTLQDAISLSAATACNGGTAAADIHGEAATGSIGVRATSSGNGFGSSMAVASVGLNDYWLITAPPGIAANTSVRIPVTIKVDGVISPGASFDPVYGAFLAFNMNISDHYNALSPTGQFVARGTVATSGSFSRTFTGNVDLFYFGPNSLPIRADIALSLDVVSLLEGSVDFYNTASIALTLPAGFSAATSAGLPLLLAPVPERETWLMLFAGLATLGGLPARKKGASRLSGARTAPGRGRRGKGAPLFSIIPCVC